MIFISDYSLRSKDTLLLTTFSYREAGGLTHMCPLHLITKNKKIFRKIKKIFILEYISNLKILAAPP